MSEDYGPWVPLTVDEVLARFAGAPFRWWFSGGVALELFVGSSWRAHADIDVGIRRDDAVGCHGFVGGLDPFVATGGHLRPWLGEPLDFDEGNLWLRRPGGPWALDIVVGAGTDDEWVYRRNESVRRQWAEAVLVTSSGVPYLAPELQLLFKSAAPRPKDEQDFAVVRPHLGERRRADLLRLLPSEHPWADPLRA